MHAPDEGPAEERMLAGVRILDLSRLLPGPACTWYLQGLGAEVIKVEDPRGGDWSRHIPPLLASGEGAWFSVLNAGKRSVALDLKDEQGRAALEGLLATADVLIEGFRPGVMARLGLDPAQLCARFPRLIVASLSGFGQQGPMASLPGHDLGYRGLTGELALGARQAGVPVMPGLQLADLAGGALTCALAIAAALVARARTGRGRWLDVSMTDGTLALMACNLAQTAAGQPPQPGAEPLTGGLPVYGVYRCKDGGIVAVAALEPKFQQALSDGLQRVLGRHVPLTRQALEAALAQRDRDSWAVELQDACVTAVLEPDEVLGHDLHRARGMVVGEGSDARVCPPFPGAAVEVTAAPPAVGEANAELLGVADGAAGSAIGRPPQPTEGS